jgi:ATP-dependent Clp protease adaptor protein ClpS
MTTDVDVVIDEKIKITNKEPSKYNIIMLNDDYTPMEWVIEVLKSIYKHSQESAEKITLTIHNEGSCVVGTYIYEIAEQKASETIAASRNKGFPLQVKIEEANE